MSTREAAPSIPAERLVAAIDGEIQPVRVTRMYGVGMFLVAIGMILLPLIYLSLIAGVAYATYFHATHSLVIFEGARGRGRGSAKGAALAYFGPIVIGCILVFFMVKPLFAGRGKQQKPVRLRPEDEPALFAYVARLCRAVHAPPPREICVDCDVNASASFRRGAWSLFGNDLTLTIGLPLAAGMSLRQLSGVLAHEFGHFSQGFGMRLTYVIRTISGWFVRVVYERDAWDARLEEWAQGGWTWATIVLQLARLMVWVTRRILWVLMWVGHALSAYMLRQMEFDADRHQARLVGSDGIAATSERVMELSIAHQMAMTDLGQFHQEGRLADDLPRLLLANVAQIPTEYRDKARASDLEAKTGVTDTHPAWRDRIDSARREQAQGIYHSPIPLGGNGDSATSVVPADEADPPAQVLFGDFPRLSRDVTLTFYRDALERDIRPEELHVVDDLLGRQAIETEGAKALERLMQGCASILRVLPLPDDSGSPPADIELAREELQQARAMMLADRDRYRAAFRLFDDAETAAFGAARAAAVLATGAKVDRQAMEIPFASADAARVAEAEAQRTMLGQTADLQPLEAAAARRILCAMRLLRNEEFRAGMDGASELADEGSRVFPAARRMADLHGGICRLRELIAQFATLLGAISGNENHAGLIAEIRGRAAGLRRLLVETRDALQGAPYPFEHAEASMTLDRFVFSIDAKTELPAADDLGELYGVATQAGQRLLELHLRLLGRLARLVERVEAQLQLEPIPVPEPAAATPLAP